MRVCLHRSIDRLLDQSIDCLVDPSSRPNYMPSHFHGFKSVQSLNFRRVACGFHSVLEQASFDMAFRSDFEHFESPKGPENRCLRHFFSMFSLNVFLHAFSMLNAPLGLWPGDFVVTLAADPRRSGARWAFSCPRGLLGPLPAVGRCQRSHNKVFGQ